MKVKLIKHNSDNQMNYRKSADTRSFLLVGEVYEPEAVIKSDWFTEVIIGGKSFNSVCFEEVKPSPSTGSKSDCCGGELRVDTADEGTSCYVCGKCGKPCDPKPSPSPSKGCEKECPDCRMLPGKMIPTNDMRHCATCGREIVPAPNNKLNEPCPYCKSRTCCLVLTQAPRNKDACPECGATGAHFCVGKNHNANKNKGYFLEPRPKDSEAVRTVDELNKIGQDFWQEYMSMISMEAHPTTAAGRLHELWFDALRHERERKA